MGVDKDILNSCSDFMDGRFFIFTDSSEPKGGGAMTKTEAINKINGKHGVNTLNKSNTHFANLNSAKDVWWYDIPTSKAFLRDITCLHLLAYNPIENEIYHMNVPTRLFKENRHQFVIRIEKSTISLELSTRRYDFLKDVRPGCGGVTFQDFLQY
jgi:hypothetical protein